MRTEKHDVRCDACGKTFSARLITVVDRRRTSDRTVTPQEVFTAVCPHCSRAVTVDHFAVWYDGVAVCSVTCEEEKAALEEVCAALASLHRQAEIPRRFVTSPARFCEKIQIFAAGLDDRVVEIVKLYYVQSFLSQYPSRTVLDALFVSEGEILGFWINCADGKFFMGVTPEQLAQAAQNLSFPSPAPDTVDGNWALEYGKERGKC